MIVCWHDPVVCLSVCRSVCNVVHVVALRVGVGAKSCTSVFLAGKFLFVRWDTFAVGHSHLAT